MSNKVTQMLERMNLRQTLADKRKRSILISSGLVFLLLVSIAVVPAFGIERVLVCEAQEHAHAEDCYVLEAVPAALRLACGAKAHAHSEVCLDAEGVVVCGKADYLIHAHNEYCYAGEELICTLSEHSGEAHAHADTCRDENGALVCGELEVSSHSHSEACVDADAPAEKSVLVCDIAEHTHASDCYEIVNKNDVSASDTSSASDTTTAPVSVSDSSASDLSEQALMLSELLISEASDESDVGENVLKLGTTTVTIPAKSKATYTFVMDFSHAYKFSWTAPSNGTYTYFDCDDSNGAGKIGVITSGNYSGTTNFTGGEQYTFYFTDERSQSSEDYTVDVTFEVTDAGHVFTDGVCGCGLKEEDLYGECGENATWSFKDGVLTISGSGAMADYSSGNAPWYRINTSVEKIVVEDGITDIGNYAFYNLNNATEAVISDSVTTIGTAAFQLCNLLEELDIPESLVTIGASAFSYCYVWQGDEIPETVTTIGGSAFRDCRLIESMVIPDSVTSFGDGVFYGCENLTTVKLPSTLTSIGNNTFRNCKMLESIDIPDTVTSIGNYAFYSCDSLTHITVPDGVTRIGSYAFEESDMLESVTLPDSVTTLGACAFRGCKVLKDVTLPSQLTTIEQYLFYYCYALESVEIPSSVKTIGGYAFYGCNSLKSINIPDTVTSIGNNAFTSCSALGEVHITDLEAWCKISFNTAASNPLCASSGSLYLNGEKLTQLVVPDSVTSIRNFAFYNCDSIEIVEIPDTVTSIGQSAFYSCNSLEEVSISASVTTLGKYTFQYCSILREVEFDENSTLTYLPDGVFQNCNKLESINIPDSVTRINQHAFGNCTALKELIIPENVTTLDTGAINNTSYDNLIINSKNLTTVAADAISSSTKREMITIGSSVDTISSQLATCLNRQNAETKIVFEGENHFTLDSPLNSGCFGNELPAGDYYADAAGGLYHISDDGTATLVCAPFDATDYTVLADVPTEDGGTAKVTGVAKGAITKSTSLASLTFESPESINSLPSGSLSHCPTLESVNGKTTVNEAYALFTNDELVTNDYLFFNTGLEEEGEVTSSDLNIFSNNTETLPIIRVVSGKNDGKNNPDFADTFNYYTGEKADITIAISNADSGEYDATRVYFAFDNPGGTLSWAFGEHSVKTDTGTVYNVKVAKSDVPNVYYVEFPRPVAGDTIAANIDAYHPSPNTPGGTLRVWPVVIGKDELESISNSVVGHTENYNELYWQTKPDDFRLTKSKYVIGNLSPFLTTDENGVARLYNVAFRIDISRIDDTLLGVG